MRSYLGMTNWPIEEPGAILKNRKYIDKTVPRSLSFYITKTKYISDAFQKSLFMLLTKYTQSSFTKLQKKTIFTNKKQHLGLLIKRSPVTLCSHFSLFPVPCSKWISWPTSLPAGSTRWPSAWPHRKPTPSSSVQAGLQLQLRSLHRWG